LLMEAGLSLEMPTGKIYTKRNMVKAFDEGKFTLNDINENIRRLLRVMFLVGIFDDQNKLPKGSRNTPEHQKLARNIAEDGIVLLKNENDLLPLDINKVNRLAVIGPNANFKVQGGDIMIYIGAQSGSL